MKDKKLLFKILKCWTNRKVNQQQLHPQQQQLLLPPFAVRRATNHNPVDRHFENAWAAARCNIATKSANERIGVQEGTNKNVKDSKRREKKRTGAQAAVAEAVAVARINNQNNAASKYFHTCTPDTSVNQVYTYFHLLKLHNMYDVVYIFDVSI